MRIQFDVKSRTAFHIGNAALVLGLALKLFIQPAGETARLWVHFVVGVLLGFALVVEVYAIGCSLRCQKAAPERKMLD